MVAILKKKKKSIKTEKVLFWELEFLFVTLY